MIVLEHSVVIPIGCSCINRFQIEYHFRGRRRGGLIQGSLFDWNITSPTSTIEFLERASAGGLRELMTQRRGYGVENGRLRHEAFEAMYFWHDKADEVLAGDQRFEGFAAKVGHLVENMLRDFGGRRVELLWSNLQPNLQTAVAKVPVPWDLFTLTEARHERLRDAAARLYGDGARLSFVGRAEDVAPVLHGRSDVHLFDLPRSADYQGPEGLYGALFDELVGAAPSVPA